MRSDPRPYPLEQSLGWISNWKTVVGTPELDFGTLKVRFRGWIFEKAGFLEWISGSPVSRMDT
jgi:hypothetical protein